MAKWPWAKDKTLLITGGTGSLGNCLTKMLLRDTEIGKVIILSRDAGSCLHRPTASLCPW